MRNWIVFVIVLIATAVGIGGLAAASSDATPEKVDELAGAETSRDWFHLSPREFYVGMDTDYQQRRVRSSTSGRQDTLHKNRDLWLEEYVGVGFDGDICDPNLLSYSADLEFGLAQSWFDEDIDNHGSSEYVNGSLQNYDFAFEALRDKPFSVSGYARHFDQRIPRRFLPSLREEQTEAGISALAVTDHTQTEFGISWRDIERYGNRSSLDNESFDTGRFFIDHTWTISDAQKLRAQYEHGRERNTYQGTSFDFETRYDEVRLEHEWVFGSEKQHRLDTFFRWNDERGNLARNELEFVPRLTLEHSDKFKTIYRYGLYDFSQDAISVQQHKFDIQALYRPNDEWRLSGDAFGLYERTDEEIDTQQYGLGFDATWQKPTDLGELSMNVAFAYDQRRTSGDDGRRLIRDEAHQLGLSTPTYLVERNVLMGTIVAHDGTRGRYFVPGVDYTVVRLDGRVRIRRVPTGRIAQGDVVYFDYQYLVPVDATVDAFRTDFLVEHRFDFGLTPYYGLESRCESVDASEAASRFETDTYRHRLGLRYAKNRYEVGTEYEIFDDTIEPYDAWHLTGRAILLESLDHSIDTSAELSRYWFSGGVDDRDVWWLDVDIKDRFRLNRYMTLTTGADYHWEDDSSDGTTNGLDLSCGLAVVRRYLTVELTAEYDLLSLMRNDEQNFGVYLRVRRDLSHVFSSDGASGK